MDVEPMTAEAERTRLICAIATVIRDDGVSDEARAAGLTFIGWLARRMPGEASSDAGVEEMLRRLCCSGSKPPNGHSKK